MHPGANFPTRVSDYRPDIDGLRAIAVMAVVFFHAFPNKISGGFIGVDVFFVISGFLITRHILKDLSSGKFSIADFYSRRIRRIFPALLFVLCCVLLGNWFFMLPSEYAELGKHTASGIGFVSNLVLLGETGYFDKASLLKPLLHLWSLGIEEQFYIFWPLLLGLVGRKKGGAIWATTLITAVSFVLNILIVRNDQASAFYLPYTRFWELLMGAWLAWSSLNFKNESLAPSKAANIYSWVGIFLLGIGMFRIREGLMFPGFYALLPTLGTALIIHAGTNAWINRKVLSHPASVSIGLISYPLYLWHWPILVMLNQNLTLSRTDRIGAILVSVVLSWLTYRFLETPLKRFNRRKNVIALVSAAILLFSFSLVIWKNDGFKSRFPRQVNEITQPYSTESHYRFKKCFLDSKTQTPNDFAPECMPAQTDSKPIVLLWGDSHAAHLVPGLQKVLSPARFNFWQLTASSCPPLLNGESKDNGSCDKIIQFVAQKVKEIHPSTVILGSRWSRDSDHFREKLEETSRFLTANGVKKIIFFGPPPQWIPTVKDIEIKAFRKTHTLPARLPLNSDALAALDEEDQRLKATCDQLNIEYVSPKKILCNSEGCLTLLTEGEKSELISSDYDHYTAFASRYVVEHALSGWLNRP